MRACGKCTRCCEGWLHGNANGKIFNVGRPCHYMRSDGCSIYHTRPVNPCRTYHCEWLQNDELPEWLKPDLANIIITKRRANNIEYLEVLETGQTIASNIFNWLILWTLANGINLHYQVAGGWNFIGSDEFQSAISAIEASSLRGGLTVYSQT